MNPEFALLLQLLNILILPSLWAGIKWVIRVEKKITLIQTKLGIEIE